MTTMPKIIFAGTPIIAQQVLSTLLHNNFPVIAALTQPDRKAGRGRQLQASPVKNLAQQYNIPVLQPESLKNSDVYQQLLNLEPDVILVMAYGLIVPKNILTLPKYGCINLHASILPQWRGAAPIQYSILSGDRTTGITVMQMNAKMDDGDILNTYTCNIAERETAGTLHDKLIPIAQLAALESMQNLPDLQKNAIPQNYNLATFAHKINKPDTKINWAQPAIQIDRFIRAMHPKPSAITTIQNNLNIKILEAHVIPQNYNYKPGTIINISNTGIIVATSQDAICITLLQFPNKNPVTIKDLLNSNYFDLNKTRAQSSFF